MSILVPKHCLGTLALNLCFFQRGKRLAKRSLVEVRSQAELGNEN